MKMSHNTNRRKLALENYYQNPNRCKNCGEAIKVPEGVKVKQIRLKVFCGLSCSAAFNNSLYPKRKRSWATRPLKVGNCQRCRGEIYSRDGRRRYCDSCVSIALLKGMPKLSQKPKGALFSTNANWQSARSSIRAHASKVFGRSNVLKECYVCGYKIHVEIAHLRPVSDFPNDALIGEINDISNLIALCPNHHWELDHGLLKLKVK